MFDANTLVMTPSFRLNDIVQLMITDKDNLDKVYRSPVSIAYMVDKDDRYVLVAATESAVNLLTQQLGIESVLPCGTIPLSIVEIMGLKPHSVTILRNLNHDH